MFLFIKEIQKQVSPSQTWLNGIKNNEFLMVEMLLSSYSAGTDIDGGNSGTDWIEFGFTESLKTYVLNNFGWHYRKPAIALYGFTSTSQTLMGMWQG
jgi:hypothetical protein